MLKPAVGLLSIGVVRVNDEEHLLDTYKETEAVMADTFLTKDGAMGKLSDCDGVLPRGASPLNCAVRASFMLLSPPPLDRISLEWTVFPNSQFWKTNKNKTVKHLRLFGPRGDSRSKATPTRVV